MLVLLLVLVATISFSHYIEKSWGITHEFKETIGIPLQQVAAVVADEGKLTADEVNFISNIMPIDAIKSQYNPYYADQLKWSEVHVNSAFLNKNRGAFLSTWFQIGIKNLPIYVKAYLQATYDFWSLDNKNQINRAYFRLSDGFDDWYRQENISAKDILPENLQSTVEPLLTKATVTLNEGSLFWIFAVIICVLMYRHGSKIFLIASPIFGAWLTIMISTPIAYQFRYILYIPMALPLIFGILLLDKSQRLHM